MQTQATSSTSDPTHDTMITPQSLVDPTTWFTEADPPRTPRVEDHHENTTAPLHAVEVESLRFACAAPERVTAPGDETRECPISRGQARLREPEGATTPSLQAAAAAHEVDARRELALQIVDAVAEVHSALGSGLLEAAYAQCLAHELSLRALHTEQHVAVPLVYKGKYVSFAAGISLVVEGRFAVQIETVDALLPAHEQRARRLLALVGLERALIVNFHAASMSYGTRWVERG